MLHSASPPLDCLSSETKARLIHPVLPPNLAD